MEIRFSRHALEKMRQRCISRNLVITTINDPDFVRYGKLERKEIYKKFKQLHLKVVVVQNEVITVITTHWVGKLN